MAALTFNVSAKNAYMDGIIGKTTSFGYYVITYLRVYTAGLVILNGTNGSSVSWGTAVQGTAPLNTVTLTPAASGVAAAIEWWQGTSYPIATGAASLSGGGGNLILPSLTLATGTPIAISSTLRVPLNNGGTLRMGQILAKQIVTCMTNNAPSPQLAAGGTLTIYSGTQPVTADTAITSQVALATLTLASADFLTAVNGATDLTAEKTVTPGVSGTATWARLTKGSYILDGSVGTAGTDFLVSTNTLVSGVNMQLTGMALSVP